MNVAAVVAEKHQLVTAFVSELLAAPSHNVPLYRRPSSPNVPLSRLRHEAARRERRWARPAYWAEAAAMAAQHAVALRSGVSNASRKVARAPSTLQRALLRKRRAALQRRRRPSAQRRHHRRELALKHGRRKDGEGVALEWLPSHALCCKRLHYVRRRIRVALGGNERRTAKALLAVPQRRIAKIHRQLVRWARQLPVKRLEGRSAASSSTRSCPSSFLIDLSHFCVYGLPSSDKRDLADWARRLRFAPQESGEAEGSVCTMGEPQLRQTKCLHGHMWSSSANTEVEHPERSIRAARLVPCTLVAVPITSSVSFAFGVVLVAPAPVKFPATETQIELLSAWSTQASASAGASLFEWWSAPAAESLEDRLLQVCRCVTARTSLKQPSESLALVLPPSFVDSGSGVSPTVLQKCVRQVVVLHTEGPTHFERARRFFSLLLAESKRARPMEIGGYRPGGVKTIGYEDRSVLLRELGRPVFPLDYGQTVKSSACVSVPELVKVHTLPLRAWGNLRNAGQRVLVRTPLREGRLPVSHCSPGCRLVERCASSAVRVAGIVTSAGYFMERLGTVVAPVWCCVPKVPAPGHDTVLWLCAAETAAQLLLQDGTSCQESTPASHRRKRLRERSRPVRSSASGELENLWMDPSMTTRVEVVKLYV